MPEKLSDGEFKALNLLVKASSSFEPLDARPGLSEVMADRLVALGLAEKGDCCYRWLDLSYSVGYRLTHLGWVTLDIYR